MGLSLNNIDEIFESRFGGAANIHGIHIQILYSIFRAFDLYSNNGPAELQLEGIEDIDLEEKNLKSIRFPQTYIQVKSTQGIFYWSNFCGSNPKKSSPLKHFLEVAKVDSSCEFQLVIHGRIDKKLAKLKEYQKLAPNKQEGFFQEFHSSCHQFGELQNYAERLINKLQIITIDENNLLSETLKRISHFFDLVSGTEELFLHILFSKFLDFAQIREKITKSRLEEIKFFVKENLAKETQFEVFGKGFIQKLVFKEDGNTEDFFEGKKTRLEHIVKNVDVIRVKWLNLIHQALKKKQACIIRTASGQGKSTLLYRYAHDYTIPEMLFQIKSLQEHSQVFTIAEYLKARAKLGLRLLVIIDDANYEKRLWSSLVSELSGENISFIISVREEDWYRYAGDTSRFSHEVITPVMDLNEAKEIFKVFQSKDKIAKGIVSAEWAYEKVSERKLLMEYVYLITHGEMLSERLASQIRFIQQQETLRANDKLNILRSVSLADLHSIRLTIEKLRQRTEYTSDVQQLLIELDREYLLFYSDKIEGLHTVRSSHLIDILFKEADSLYEQKALELISLAEEDDIQAVIASLFHDKKVSREKLINRIKDEVISKDISWFNNVLDGAFSAGEQFFFDKNKPIFDKVFNEIGENGIFLLSADHMPIIQTNIIDNMTKIMGENVGYYPFLKECSKEIQAGEIRGCSFVREVIDAIGSLLQTEFYGDALKDTGYFLNVCGILKKNLSSLDQWVIKGTWKQKLLDMEIEGLSLFAQGLWRYNKEAWDQFLKDNQKIIKGVFKYSSRTLAVEKTDSDIGIKFFVEANIDATKQAVSRLEFLKQLFPTCKHYKSEGIYTGMFGLQPSMDNAHKNIPIENIPFKTDINWNVIWKNISIMPYKQDSYYLFQNNWYEHRSILLEYGRKLLNVFEKILKGKRVKAGEQLFNPLMLQAIEKGFMFRFSLPPQTPEEDKNEIEKEITNWSSSMRNFFYQFMDYLTPAKEKKNTLWLYNLNNSIKSLPLMHGAFEKLFVRVPDYFEMKDLNEGELRIYPALADILELWKENIGKRINNPHEAVRVRKNLELTDLLKNVKSLLNPLENQGFRFILPNKIYTDFPLKYLPIGFEIRNFHSMEQTSLDIALQLSSLYPSVDYICPMPMIGGKCFMNRMFSYSNTTIKALKDQSSDLNWEYFVPVEIGEEILKCFGNIEPLFVDEFKIYKDMMNHIQELNDISEQSYWVLKYLNEENPYEARLKEDYFNHFAGQWNEDSRKFKQLSHIFTTDTNNIELEIAWKQVINKAKEIKEKIIKYDEIDIETFQTLTAYDLLDMKIPFDNYLIKKYLPDSSENIIIKYKTKKDVKESYGIAWEYLLLEELLRINLQPIQQKIENLPIENENTPRVGLDFPLALKILMHKIGEISMTVQRLSDVINNELVEALGPIGQSGDENKIAYSVEAIIRCCWILYNWSLSFRTFTFDARLEKIIKLMEKWTIPMIRNVFRFQEELTAIVNNPKAKGTYEIKLIFEAPNNLEELLKEIELAQKAFSQHTEHPT